NSRPMAHDGLVRTSGGTPRSQEVSAAGDMLQRQPVQQGCTVVAEPQRPVQLACDGVHLLASAHSLTHVAVLALDHRPIGTPAEPLQRAGPHRLLQGVALQVAAQVDDCSCCSFIHDLTLTETMVPRAARSPGLWTTGQNTAAIPAQPGRYRSARLGVASTN